MSLLDRLREWVGGDGSGPSPAYHIIDVAGLAGNGGRTSPRERVALLQKLAQFVERENLEACALVEGRPLREAPEGKPFKSLVVYYGETAEQLFDRARELVRTHRHAMLVTHRRDLEEWAQQNRVPTLRASSLRRALDENGGNRGGDGNRTGGGNRNRTRRPPRARRPAGGGRQQGEQQQAPKSKPAQPDAPKADGVSDLIDLV